MATRREFLGWGAAVAVGGLPGWAAGADNRKSSGGKPAMSMVVETVFTEGIAHLSYLVGDKATGKAAVIDPRRDVEAYVDLARRHKLTITHALETHVHADFVSGTRELCDRTGTARPHLSVEGGAEYGFKFEPVKGGTVEKPREKKKASDTDLG